MDDGMLKNSEIKLGTLYICRDRNYSDHGILIVGYQDDEIIVHYTTRDGELLLPKNILKLDKSQIIEVMNMSILSGYYSAAC